MDEKVFYLDNQKRIITDINIINTKLVNQSKIFNSEYILYIIKIISPFNSWIIKKRYSEIKDIYDFLVKKKPKLVFPQFPPKRLFSTKEETIIERKNRFDEIFFFILQNVEILRYNKLIDFFNIKKTILVIYIKNCMLVNENRLTYEAIDDNNSSSSSNDLDNISNSSDKENTLKKDKKNEESIKIKIYENNNKMKKNLDKKSNKISDSNKIINFTKNDNSNNNINDIINNINFNNEEEQINKGENNINIKKIIKSNTNYFKCFEEFKLASGEYTSRSQVSFFIIKELLRNLKVHSSHIFEIIIDFSDYIKLKKKWKKFNEKEITSLFIGINKDELFEDYYQSILKDEKPTNKYSSSSLSEKSTLSSTGQSINISNSISYINYSNITFKESNGIIDEEINNKMNYNLEGILYYIGNFEKNYLGARSCLLFINKIFERDFNPEVDIYIKLFKKIDINYIQKMNICKFSMIKNYINQKLCFNLLNNYIDGYTEKKQIKILNELNADSFFINKFLDNKFIGDNINNPYNLE